MACPQRQQAGLRGGRGKPDVFFTEFIPVDGLFSKGYEKVLETLKFTKKEQPIVAQIWGSNPENFYKAAGLIKKLGFDGIDINMGCPDRDIEKQGAGAALIKNPVLAKEIIRAALRGAQNKQKKIPVSIKTRIGYNKNEISTWIPTLLEEDLAALTIHLRTRKEMYATPAHWELAEKIVKLRGKYAPKTLIIGNGDVKSVAEARELIKKTRVDGVMFGRSVLGNPWFFAPRSLGEVGFPTTAERLNAIIEHAELFEGEHFESIKKHFHAYAKGFEGAKELRESLMKVKNLAETKKVIENFLDNMV